MNIILVKYKTNSSKEYCFEVPEELVPLARKDCLVLCETEHGFHTGKTTSDVFSGAGAQDVAKRLGATFPLKRICKIVQSIDVDAIKIPKMMKKTIPSGRKIGMRVDEYRTTGRFDTKIIVDENNNLRDGYTAYLVCKMLGIKKLVYGLTESAVSSDHATVAEWQTPQI